MSNFDDLPKHHRTHRTEQQALVAFEARLLESEVFVLQQTDRKDYGTDCQIEVLDSDNATNVRIHVQLKGTEKHLNADHSVSVTVDRPNLNYLLTQPYSIYVCYHVPTKALLYCSADGVLEKYEHSGKNWTEQTTLTVSFSDELTFERLRSIAALAKSAGTSLRDLRVRQIGISPEDVPRIVRVEPGYAHVSDDPERTRAVLRELYENGSEDVISAAFDRYVAVLGMDDDAMGWCYMAEINLGMAGRSRFPERIERAIAHFEKRTDGDRFQPGSIHYTIGNAFSALGREERAREAFEKALGDGELISQPDLAAQVFKNLGTSLWRLGDKEGALEHFRSALANDPDLSEAHNALGHYYTQVGRYPEALDHFDQVAFQESKAGMTSMVEGWRINVLFNMGEGRAAFRDINRLLTRACHVSWIWPWCARQVSNFGRTTAENARQAIAFWKRYIQSHDNGPSARRELLMSSLYVHAHGGDIGKTFAEFRRDFERHVAGIPDGEKALLWDRLGHCAQDEENWIEAQQCFQAAYGLGGGDYGYCLGVALNSLGRCEESLPILLDQAQVHQPDAMSWFQVAIAYEGLGKPGPAIKAYKTALELDPDHELAAFNLGGIHLNYGDVDKARVIWAVACERFPNHELAKKVMTDFSFLFDDMGQ